MSPTLVRRALFLFAAGLLVAALVFTVLVSRPREAPAVPAPATAGPEGAALFDQRCASCHRLDEVIAFVRARPDVEAGRRALLTLLEQHGDVTADEAAVLVTFVTRSAYRPGDTR